MGSVFPPTGPARKVKNLGWFFKKARTTIIKALYMTRDRVRNSAYGDQLDSWEMTAQFDDGYVYKSVYADMSVFKSIMGRQRSLRGVTVQVTDDGREYDFVLGDKT